MSFRDWSEGSYEEFYQGAYESIYNNIEGTIYLSNEQQERAEALFEAGWLTFGEYSPNELDAIRNDFYDLVGLDESDFDWVEYRELYDSAGG